MGELLGQVWGPLAQLLGVAQGAAGGSVTALVTQLENAGLAEQVGSWMGEGDNLPVTEAELEAAFTPEQLNAWAEHAGTTPDALLELMSRELPGTMSRASREDPEGPSQGA